MDLTAKGVEEARAAGRLLAAEGYDFDLAFTSVLKRAIRTLNLALEEMDRLWLPVEKDWRLNERHYGALQGLNKAETAAKFGEEQVLVWRRSYDTPPPALDAGRRARRRARSALRGLGRARCRAPNASRTPSRASSRTGTSASRRAWPAGERVLVAAHGNSLRALVKYLRRHVRRGDRRGSTSPRRSRSSTSSTTR